MSTYRSATLLTQILKMLLVLLTKSVCIKVFTFSQSSCIKLKIGRKYHYLFFITKNRLSCVSVEHTTYRYLFHIHTTEREARVLRVYRFLVAVLQTLQSIPLFETLQNQF